ncbi:hypothetical protein Sp14A_19400 [Streptococcus pluranimalium]|uniref:Lipoprotein n=1 Tax=Streptococcus pluranimalium TaxID=82348 RepID=A0A345VM75_9STRE|nr:hypothetical protein Sp14A_19400 [Streptococcus pluranimalium]
MKKTLSLLALLFTFFLVACSNTTSDNTKSSSSEKVSMVEVVLTPLEKATVFCTKFIKCI